MPGAKVVIVGAGVVGCALADELTARGWTDVTVLEQGPLFVTGGSSSHAPGLVFQTNPSRTMSRLAHYTVEKLTGLDCFDPAACTEKIPLLDQGRILGGLHVPSDGLALAVKACEVQAARATERGARFVPRARVTKVIKEAGKVAGVETENETYEADIVVSAAGFWGPDVGSLAGVTIPLLPMAHQYVRTTPVGAGDDMPILRHQDRDLYFRAHGDTLGIGSYLHEPMPVNLEDLPESEHPSMMAFTPDTFAESWAAAADLLPALADAERADGFNGVFSFTADGFPLLGESRDVKGFWSAEAVWVTHSAGAAKAVAQWIVTGRPGIDLHECDLNRFDPAQLSPAYLRERAVRSFVEVYDIIHPLDPPSVRDVRVSPFHQRQTELGAVFGEAGATGWERPLWYGVNRPPQAPRPRDAWSARHWSPIAETEARTTRERVALYDMTPLMRLEVTGPVAFLQSLTSNNVDRKPGSVCYTLLLDSDGGIRSDITVARLAEDRFQVGVNGPLDLDWLQRHADHRTRIRDVTAEMAGLGVWGPKARDLVKPLTDVDVTNESFRYFQCREGHLGTAPVTMLRVSYVGELGWEIYTRADYAQRLWDTLWEAGREHGLIAAGRAAFTSLRLEKGYRAWGVDMTTEDTAYQAGLGFAVPAEPPPAPPGDRRLTCLVLADEGAVPMGREPVYADGPAEGFVTSAAFGHTVGAPIAYAWLPSSRAVPGTELTIGYFDRRLRATVAAEPLFDPKHERLKL
jgi:glycine cleavage system aminomethyltransferase T/glycine/D-amino acid oxidase-like deaminating enzyme